jgi:hypothetical protein
VHQQPGDDDVRQLARRARPLRAQGEQQRREAREAEGVAQREEREGRRVLDADLGGDVARSPDRDEVPRQQGVDPAARGDAR